MAFIDGIKESILGELFEPKWPGTPGVLIKDLKKKMVKEGGEGCSLNAFHEAFVALQEESKIRVEQGLVWIYKPWG